MAMDLKEIENLIKAALPDASIEIQDLAGDGNHYSATVISSQFSGKNIIEQHDTIVGKYFDLLIQLLIILSLISFSVETIPNLSGKTILYLYYFELFTIIVFSVEYLLRLYVADKKLKYIFSLIHLNLMT